MMESVSSCARALDDDRAVLYLQDALPEDEREAFEVHLLECDDCSDLLEAARLARDVLQEEAPPARTVRPFRIVRVASLAAGLAAAAAASFLLLRPGPVAGPVAPPRIPVASPPPPDTAPRAVATLAPAKPSPELAALGRVEPPTYLPLATRAPAATNAAFDLAMAHYARREYVEAAEGLRAVVRERPSSEGWFFLGVSELMAGRTREARATLARAALSGQPPYAGAAMFFGAKADLQLGDTEAARQALRDVMAGGGPYAAEAKRLLERLGKLEPGPRP
jgi:TolA-binding protein